MTKDDPRYACSPPRPAAATRPGADYFRAVDDAYSLFHFIIDTALSGDHALFEVRQLLDGVEPEDIPSPVALAEKTPGPRLRFLRRKRQLLFEMLLGRLVDGFQTYLVGLIKTVLRTKPEMLASRQPTVSIEDVLRHSTIEDLLHEVIERRVGNLAYEGFGALESWCLERGIEIPVSEADRAKIVEVIATRNLIAHAHGCVDERYLKAFPGSGFAVGNKRPIDGDYYFDALTRLQSLVSAIDARAIEKFKLPVEEIAPQGTPDSTGPRGDA